LADNNGVPPFVIFSDVALQQMAYYYPNTTEQFSRISGVGDRKLKTFGAVFMDIINKYISENNISPRDILVSPSKQKKSKKVVVRASSNCHKTQVLLEIKMPLTEIADKLGFQVGTIIRHIEQLLSAGEKLDLEYLRDSKSENDISEAIKECGATYLRPIFEHLNGKYSYDEIRLEVLLNRINEN